MSDETVYTFEKNSREEIRATFTTYKGKALVSLRVWYDADENDGSGESVYRPSKKGITIARDKLPELRAAVDALIEADRAA